ncbi:pilus assembly protein [Sulfitobacter sp. F26169L]|uniref:TadE/TadG family type IV pilus assembly protein n=1 Tax=Sulfitobacter sp. F26169L TaxID=2996015 RepID=UPI002260CFD7|nr:TadE/TadG family type IV pilus assembly protein [Sulfitobacter sp. F26169L]MCX7568006.1 pilus assembly protein [Sulfitobacter sp. F26169L]
MNAEKQEFIQDCESKMIVRKAFSGHDIEANCRKRNNFLTREEGAATVEAVIWVPIFFVLLAIMINLSMVFFSKSQIIRVVQDGNRALSLGRLDDAAAVEAYIGQNLAYLGPNMVIQTTVSGGQVDTVFSVPATDLMPLDIIGSAFDSVKIGVHAQHLIEF